MKQNDFSNTRRLTQGRRLSCARAHVPTEKGNEKPLSDYAGKVVLVVNTASKCGFTPQYGGLEQLYKDIKGKHPDDFEIIGFPCNQFGSQEPGTDDEIQSFCQVNYGVSFPVRHFFFFLLARSILFDSA